MHYLHMHWPIELMCGDTFDMQPITVLLVEYVEHCIGLRTDLNTVIACKCLNCPTISSIIEF